MITEKRFDKMQNTFMINQIYKSLKTKYLCLEKPCSPAFLFYEGHTSSVLCFASSSHSSLLSASTSCSYNLMSAFICCLLWYRTEKVGLMLPGHFLGCNFRQVNFWILILKIGDYNSSYFYRIAVKILNVSTGPTLKVPNTNAIFCFVSSISCYY